MALCLRVLRLNVRTRTHRLMSTAPTDNIFAEEEAAMSEEEIEAKRLIHRMSDRTHKRRLKQEYVGGLYNNYTINALRKDFVSFGAASGINPGVCWPNKEEIADLHMIEKKFYKTFDELKQQLDEKRAADQKAFVDREVSLEENLKKLQQWRNEMLAREEKVRKAEEAKRAKMDELIREVREHIGYNLDPSDPKFKEVMEMKEAERKKAEKEAKRLAKKEKMMQRLMTVPKMAEPVATPASPGETQQSASETPATNAAATSKDGESK